MPAVAVAAVGRGDYDSAPCRFPASRPRFSRRRRALPKRACATSGSKPRGTIRMIAADNERGTPAAYNLRESGCATWSSRADAAVRLWTDSLAANHDARPDVWRIADIGCGDEKLRGP